MASPDRPADWSDALSILKVANPCAISQVLIAETNTQQEGMHDHSLLSISIGAIQASIKGRLSGSNLQVQSASL